jgi:hypothetical protein
VEAAAIEQEVGCASAQRQHRDVGAGEADLLVADGGPGKRGSRQIHAQAMPAPSRQIPELGPPAGAGQVWVNHAAVVPAGLARSHESNISQRGPGLSACGTGAA